MATESGGKNFSRLAGEDLRAAIYHAVKLDTTGQFVKGTAGADVLASCRMSPISEKSAPLCISASAPQSTAESVTANDDLACDANGHLVTAVAGQPVVAIALESGSVNEERSVLVLPQTPGAYPVGEQGDVLIHNGSNWVVLHHGATSGMRFETRGHGANPVYAATKEWWIFPIESGRHCRWRPDHRVDTGLCWDHH